MRYDSRNKQKLVTKNAYMLDKQISSRFEYVRHKLSDYLGFTNVFDRLIHKLDSFAEPLKKNIQNTKKELEELLCALPTKDRDTLYGIDNFGKRVLDSIVVFLEKGDSCLIENLTSDLDERIKKESRIKEYIRSPADFLRNHPEENFETTRDLWEQYKSCNEYNSGIIDEGEKDSYMSKQDEYLMKQGTELLCGLERKERKRKLRIVISVVKKIKFMSVLSKMYAKTIEQKRALEYHKSDLI